MLHCFHIHNYFVYYILCEVNLVLLSIILVDGIVEEDIVMLEKVIDRIKKERVRLTSCFMSSFFSSEIISY